jgi:hypothetical protein
MLVRFHTQAIASVTATLASIESTIESLVSRILADHLERSPEAEALQRRQPGPPKHGDSQA